MPRNAATNRRVIKNFRSSVSFNGSNTSVAYSGAAITGFDSACSFSGWAYIASGSTTTRISMARWGDGSSLRCSICFQQSSLGKEDYSLQAGYWNGTVYTLGGIARVPVNRWFHVGFTWDGTTVKAYINGVLTTGTSGSPASGNTTGLNLGNQGGAFWIGNQSNAKLWTRVLTQDEMTALSLLQDDTVSTSGLWLNWAMDDGAGTSVTDYSGNSRPGTITSGSFAYNSPAKARNLINGNMVRNGDFDYVPPFTAATANQTDRWIDGTSGGSTTNNLFGWKSGATSIYSGGTSYSMRYDTILSRSCIRIVSVGKIYKSGSTITQMGAYRTAYTASSLLEADRLNMIEVQPNTTYTLTGLYYINQCDAQVQPRIQAVEYNAALTRVATTTVDTLQDNSVAWRTVTTRFTTNSSARYVSVAGVVLGIGADFTDGNCDVAFNNVSLTPVYPEGRVPANGNLVKNFDFEVVPAFVAETATAARWIDGTAGGSTTNSTYKWATVSGAITPSASVSYDTTVFHSGTASLKLSTLNTAGAAVAANTLNTASPADTNVLLRLLPSTAYTLNFYLKTNNVATNGAYAFIREYSGSLGILATTNSTKLSGTNDWTLITLNFTTNASTQLASLALLNNVPGNISDAWFDDIYLAKTTNPGRVLIT